MPRADRPAIRFVRALLGGAKAAAMTDGRFRASDSVLGPTQVEALCAAGVLQRTGDSCTMRPEARSWLRRQMLAEDPFAAQHRREIRRPDGVRINLAESPLARLATPAAGEAAYLERHHVEAGERVRRLADRARLQPRVTMSYSAAHVAGGGPGEHAGITDMAAEARRELAEIPRLLPRECADVVLDVCGLLKGLQTVESERGWPRRSAKLVLRIGLEQLARHYGYGSAAIGPTTRRPHAWLDAGAGPDRFE